MNSVALSKALFVGYVVVERSFLRQSKLTFKKNWLAGTLARRLSNVATFRSIGWVWLNNLRNLPARGQTDFFVPGHG